MFFDRYADLCSNNGISVYKACTDLGLNRSAVAKWKNGAIPRGKTLNNIADYFSVSTDYLLGAEHKEKPVIFSDDELNEINSIFSELSPDNRSKLLELARLYLTSQHNSGGKK